MKIVAVVPNQQWVGKEKDSYFPYSLLMINGLIRDHYEFQIIDANGDNLSIDELRKKLIKSKFDMLFVSGLCIRDQKIFDMVFEVAKEVNNECVTMFGGVYPTTLPEESFADKNIDIIYLGHAENRLLPLLEDVAKGNIHDITGIKGVGYRDESGNPNINMEFESINELTFSVDPCYVGVDLNKYFDQPSSGRVTVTPSLGNRGLPIMAVHGCPYNCSFCANKSLSANGYVYRSHESIMNEIEYLVNKYKIDYLALGVDCICAKREKFLKLITSIHKKWAHLRWVALPCIWHLDNDLLEKMKECGCDRLTLSVECGKQENLNKFVNKPLNLKIVPGIAAKATELGIITTFNFLIGFPGETWEDIRESLAFAESLDCYYIQINIAQPLPKTRLYERAKIGGFLEKGFNYMDALKYNYLKGVINTPEFTAPELEILRTYEWDRINFKTDEKIKRVCEFLKIDRETLEKNRQNARRNIIKKTIEMHKEILADIR